LISGTQAHLRVVVAEDEVLIREGIRRLAETLETVEVVETVGDLRALWAAVEAHDPHVVVTDIPLAPTFSDEGIRFAVELRRVRPEVAVVVLGDEVEPEHATALFDGGTAGRAYLLKDRVGDGAAFAQTIETVAAGGSHVDAEVVGRLLDRGNERTSTPTSLTTREREVLALMAEGRSNSSIARNLGVTGRAVERHVGSVFAKLRIDDSPDSSRRVLAVLTYLADSRASARGSGERRDADRSPR
jgi:DNA-binding NarL/FixJ family response regulator